MKKHLHNSLRALFLSLAVLLSLPMLAVEVEINGINYDLDTETDQATVIAKSSGTYSGEVVIPESVEHESVAYSVTGIGYEAFRSCSVLTSVTIPNSVTSIGDEAFSGCSGLTSVTIPNSVTSIGIQAFRDCSGLTSVTIGNGVTSIGVHAFYYCSGLTSVTIPNSVTSIGDGAFEGCSGLTSVVVDDENPVYDSRNNCNAIIETATNTLHSGCKTTIFPNSVTSIGQEAFFGCSGLTSVTIPNSVTSIGESAFSCCSGLTSVTIPNSVTSIGESAFFTCSRLTSVTIPNSVTSIGDQAFTNCSGLTSVTIDNGVKSIGGYAFSCCHRLTSVTIPNSVTSIGGYAFEWCSGLTSVTIDNGVESIGEYAFANCSKLLNVYCYAENVPSTGSNTFESSPIENATLHVPDASINSYKATEPWSGFGKIVALLNYEFDAETKQATVIAKSSGKYSGKVVIPESVENDGTAYSVTSIGLEAFEGCSGLTSVTIPNSVTSIGERAFEECTGLTSVHISDIAAWCNIDFGTSLSNPLCYAHHLYLNGEEVKDLVIPNSVTSIGNYAFDNCSGLTSVTIPNSVTRIGDVAFWGCSGLTSVTIPNSVTSIGQEAFYGCSGLTSVTIGNSVTSIGSEAFRGCSGLTSVTIPNSVTSIGYSAFWGCSGLTSIVVEDGNTVYDSRNNCNAIIETATNTLLSGCKTTIIPNSVTSIGYAAFYDCSGLTSVTIGNSVENIGDWAFGDCSGLTSVTIPNSVKSIGNSAFKGCSGLTSVHISDIAAWCNIDFADSYSNPLHRAQHLYLNGEEVKDLVIPNSMTSIGDYAFRGCSGLTSVTIPNSVTSIGNYAFDNCSGLTSVTIPNSVTRIGDVAFWGCSGLTSVTIPNSVTSIGSEAFRNCSKLLDVYCYAENVPSTGSNAFSSSLIANATLHVPAASINSYEESAPWSDFGTVTPLPDLTLTDGEEFENNTEQPFSTLTYTRTLPNMLWNPLYVPFKIPYEDLEENYEVAYINAMHSYDNDDNGEIDEMVMEIVKIKVGTLKPNHPYLIKAKNEEAKVMNIVQEAATLYPAEITTLDCSSVYTKFEITGTYQEMTSGDLNGSLVISTDGAWKKLSSTSTLKPFRFYLTISSREGSPVEIAEEAMSRVRIRVMGEDDNATGIDEVNTANDEQKSEIYDLSGRRVSAPAKGGVYVINGKKVIY